jgi:hypothetical protein
MMPTRHVIVIVGWAASFVPTQGLTVRKIWLTYFRREKEFVFINSKVAMEKHAIPAEHPWGVACPQSLAHVLSGGKMCLLKLRSGHGMVGP